MKSYTTKAFILLGIVIVLCLPLALIYDTLSDRKNNERVAVESIAHSYGKEQEISTPYLIIPCKIATKKCLTIIGAQDTQTTINLQDKIKKRGIYRAIVYEAQAELSLHYDLDMSIQTIKEQNDNDSVILDYANAFLYFRIAESSGLKITNTKENQTLPFTTSKVRDANFVTVPFALDNNKQIDIGLELEFKGSSLFRLIPMSGNETIHITSTWDTISYIGIPPNEYGADSSVYEVNIPPTHFLVDSTDSLLIGAFRYEADGDTNYIGVKLLDSITQYRLIERSIKYGVLFVLLTLSLLFVCDVGTKKSLHILQYGIIGTSLVAFYLLLLSLSEQLGFLPAYFIAVLCIVIPISLYSFGILGDKKFSITLGGSLGAMYLVLLGILKIENYSLLLGSILVMAVLYAMMYFTRNLHRE